ncbi:MAG: SRPBCC family protein, partial [Polyangia bacterium]
MLETFIPNPRLTQLDHVDVAVPAQRAYEVARHLDMSRAPLVRALFALRGIPGRLRGHNEGPQRLAIDDITGEGSAFRMLADEPGHGFAVGAIGRFWKPDIEWAQAAPDAFARFDEPGWGKVAWSIVVQPRGDHAARVSVALRIDATDDEAWHAVQRYFRLIGPFSHFIRRQMLRRLETELGSDREAEVRQWLPSDALIPNAFAEDTMGIDIAATPEAIWPWLVQMGCHRAGWYSHDRLDNAGVPSATEIVPALQQIAVGDMLPATPVGDSAFEVLVVEPTSTLVLGGVFDVADGKQTRFAGPKPERFWQATWAFVLHPLDAHTTRLTVRARVAFGPAAVGLRTVW